jgi:hypothetical protein
MTNNPRFPIFIPSKGRYNTNLTANYLDYMKVPYRLVVEPQEYDLYLEKIQDKSKLLILDMSCKEKYEYCDEFGTEKATGSGPARNFIWETAIKEGHEYHWIMDDNIRAFRIMNDNKKIKVSNGKLFRSMEDFTLRYKNVYMSGPHYAFFHPRKLKRPPFYINSRVYSCNLIKNDIPFRWRGRYNEDTILSLDILKAGFCTVLFNMFLQDKSTTQTIKGGNEEIYAQGTLEKSRMLCREHPEYSKLTRKYNRWHHHIDYKVFKNTLVRKYPKEEIKKSVNLTLKRKVL